MVLVLALIVVALVLGIIGATAEGLLYLLFIGIVVLAVAIVYVGMRLRHSQRPRPR